MSAAVQPPPALLSFASANFTAHIRWPDLRRQETADEMPVRIRLRRMGRKKLPQYRIVVVDSASPRDGRFVETLGYYKPLSDPARLVIDLERVDHWLGEGADPSHTVRSLISKARRGGDSKVALGEEDPTERKTKRVEALAARRAAEQKEAQVEVEAEAAKKAVEEAPAPEVEEGDAEAEEPAADEDAAPEVEAEEPAAEDDAAPEAEAEEPAADDDAAPEAEAEEPAADEEAAPEAEAEEPAAD